MESALSRQGVEAYLQKAVVSHKRPVILAIPQTVRIQMLAMPKHPWYHGKHATSASFDGSDRCRIFLSIRTCSSPPPCFGGMVTSEYALSLLELQRVLEQIPVKLSLKLISGDSLITRARNLAVQQFLATPSATHMLFIDADIGFFPEQVVALLTADKDVCGAVYPLKHIDWDRIGRKAQAGASDLQARSLNYVVDLLDHNPEEKFLRVRYLGTGFMMIKRIVFARMAEHYPETRFRNTHVGLDDSTPSTEANAFFDCMIDPDTGTYLSEDYTFCKRWSNMGGEIWAYANSRLTHVGSHAFEGNLKAIL